MAAAPRRLSLTSRLSSRTKWFQVSVSLVGGLLDAAGRLRRHARASVRNGATARVSFSVVRAPRSRTRVGPTHPTSTSTPSAGCAFRLSDAVAGKLLHRGAAQLPTFIATRRLAAPLAGSAEKRVRRVVCFSVCRPYFASGGKRFCLHPSPCGDGCAPHRAVRFGVFFCDAADRRPPRPTPRVRGTSFTRRRKTRDAHTTSLGGCAECRRNPAVVEGFAPQRYPWAL